jgi:Tol biopolymer transport system component
MAARTFIIWLLLIIFNVPMPAAGSEPIRIAADEHEGVSPLWSPDGERISFIAKRSGRSCLVIYSLKSGTQDILADDVSGKGSYAWSPDGKHIAYTAKGSGVQVVCLVAPASKKKKILHEGKNPVFNPNGGHLAFVTKRNVLVYRVGLQKITPLTNEKEDAIFDRLAWDPSGDRIYYCRNGDLWTISSNGMGKKCVVKHTSIGSPPPFIDNPVVSAAGDCLYFSLVTDGLWSYPTDNICARHELKSGKTSQLFDANSWAISHSGRHIAYSLGKDVMLFDTGSKKTIKVCEGFEPSFSPDDKSLVYLKGDKDSEETGVWLIHIK